MLTAAQLSALKPGDEVFVRVRVAIGAAPGANVFVQGDHLRLRSGDDRFGITFYAPIADCLLAVAPQDDSEHHAARRMAA